MASFVLNGLCCYFLLGSALVSVRMCMWICEFLFGFFNPGRFSRSATLAALVQSNISRYGAIINKPACLRQLNLPVVY